MAFHNANFKAINLPVGTYELSDLGNGISASTVHQIFCHSNGVSTITAIGGGTFTWTATTGQSIDVVTGRIVVSSGEFVGFKSSYQPNWNQQTRNQ